MLFAFLFILIMIHTTLQSRTLLGKPCARKIQKIVMINKKYFRCIVHSVFVIHLVFNFTSIKVFLFHLGNFFFLLHTYFEYIMVKEMSSNFMHKGRGQASVRPVQVFMAKGSNVSWTFGLVFYFHHIHCEYFSMIWQPIKTITSTPSFLFRRIKLKRSYFSTIFLSFFIWYNSSLLGDELLWMVFPQIIVFIQFNLCPPIPWIYLNFCMWWHTLIA